MAELSGGRAVVELLKTEQVRYVFGIVGATFLDVLDALYDDCDKAGARRTRCENECYVIYAP